jgi:hypothetical protein
VPAVCDAEGQHGALTLNVRANKSAQQRYQQQITPWTDLVNWAGLARLQPQHARAGRQLAKTGATY